VRHALVGVVDTVPDIDDAPANEDTPDNGDEPADEAAES
jgi:molecular chaperone GrpE